MHTGSGNPLVVGILGEIEPMALAGIVLNLQATNPNQFEGR